MSRIDRYNRIPPNVANPYILVITDQSDRYVGNKGRDLPIVRRTRVTGSHALYSGLIQDYFYRYTISLPCQSETGYPWMARLFYEDATGKQEVHGYHGMLQIQWYALKQGVLPPLSRPLGCWPKPDTGTIQIVPRPADADIEKDGAIHGSLMFDWLWIAREHEKEVEAFEAVYRAPRRIDPHQYPIDGKLTVEWHIDVGSPLVIEAVCQGQFNTHEYNRYDRNRDTLARFQIHDIRGHENLAAFIDNPLDPKWSFES